MSVYPVSSTLSEQQQQPPSLQLQTEAESSLPLCAQQCPRIPQGFKLQGDNVSGHLPQRGTEPVRQTAAAAAAAATVEAQHIRG